MSKWVFGKYLLFALVFPGVICLGQGGDEPARNNESDPYVTDTNASDVVGIDKTTLEAKGMDFSSLFPSFPLSKDLALKISFGYSSDDHLQRRGDYHYAPPKSWKIGLGELIRLVPGNNDVPFDFGMTATSNNKFVEAGPYMKEIQTYFITSQGQTVSFFPNPEDPAFDVSSVFEDATQSIEKWYGETGTYQLEVDGSDFKLKAGNGLIFNLVHYKTEKGMAQQPGLSLHYRVQKVTDRWGNYIQATYTIPNQITFSSYKKSGYLLKTITAYLDTNGRLSRINFPKVNSGDQDISLKYYDDETYKDGTNRPDDVINTGAYCSGELTDQGVEVSTINVSPIPCTFLSSENSYSINLDMASVQDVIPSFLTSFDRNQSTDAPSVESYLLKIGNGLFKVKVKVNETSFQVFQAEPNSRVLRVGNDQPVKLRYQYDSNGVGLDYIEVEHVGGGLPANGSTNDLYLFPMFKQSDWYRVDGATSGTLQTGKTPSQFEVNLMAGNKVLLKIGPSDGLLTGSGGTVHFFREENKNRIQEIIFPKVDPETEPKRIVLTYSDPSLNHQEIEKIQYYDDELSQTTPYLQVDFTFERIRKFSGSFQDFSDGDYTDDEKMHPCLVTKNVDIDGDDRTDFEEYLCDSVQPPTPDYEKVPFTFEHEADIVRKRTITYAVLDSGGNAFLDPNQALTTFFGGRFHWTFGQSNATQIWDDNADCSIHQWGVDGRPFDFTWEISPTGSAVVYDLTPEGIGLPSKDIKRRNTRAKIFKTYHFDENFRSQMEDPIALGFDTGVYPLTEDTKKTFAKFFEFSPRAPYTESPAIDVFISENNPCEVDVHSDVPNVQFSLWGRNGFSLEWQHIGYYQMSGSSMQITLAGCSFVDYRVYISGDTTPTRIWKGFPVCVEFYSNSPNNIIGGFNLSNFFDPQSKCYAIEWSGYELVPLYKCNLSQYLPIEAVEWSYGFCEEYFNDGIEDGIKCTATVNDTDPIQRLDALKPKIPFNLDVYGPLFLKGMVNKPIRDGNGQITSWTNPLTYEWKNESKQVPWPLRLVRDPDPKSLKSFSNTARLARIFPSFSVKAKNLEGFDWDGSLGMPSVNNDDIVSIQRLSNGGFITSAAVVSETTWLNECGPEGEERPCIEIAGIGHDLRVGDVFTTHGGKFWTITKVGYDATGEDTILNFWPQLPKFGLNNTIDENTSLDFFRFFNPLSDSMPVLPQDGVTDEDMEELGYLTSNQYASFALDSTQKYQGYDAYGNHSYTEVYKRGIGFLDKEGFELVPDFMDTTTPPDTFEWNDSTDPANNDGDSWSYFGKVTKQFSSLGGSMRVYDSWDQTNPPTIDETGITKGFLTLFEYDLNINEANQWYALKHLFPTKVVTYYLPTTIQLDSWSPPLVPRESDEDIVQELTYFGPFNFFTIHGARRAVRISHSPNQGKISNQVERFHSTSLGESHSATQYDNYTGLPIVKLSASRKGGAFLTNSGTQTINSYAENSSMIEKQEHKLFTPGLDSEGFLVDPASPTLVSSSVTLYDDLGRAHISFDSDEASKVFGAIQIIDYANVLFQEVTEYSTAESQVGGVSENGIISNLEIPDDVDTYQSLKSRTYSNGLGQTLYEFHQMGVDSTVFGSKASYLTGRPEKQYVESPNPGATPSEFPGYSHFDDFFSSNRAYSSFLYNDRGEKIGTEVYGSGQKKSVSFQFVQRATDPNYYLVFHAESPGLSDTSPVLVKKQVFNYLGQLEWVVDYRSNYGSVFPEMTAAPTFTSGLSMAKYSYDRFGNLVKSEIFDRVNSNPSQTREFLYDQRGRLRFEKHPELGVDNSNYSVGSVVYSKFDFFGNAGTVEETGESAEKRTHVYTYDGQSDLTSHLVTYGGESMQTEFVYQKNVASSRYPRAVRFVRSEAANASDNIVSAYRYGYDSKGRLLKREFFHNFDADVDFGYVYNLRNIVLANFASISCSNPLDLEYSYDPYSPRILTETYPTPVASNQKRTELVYSYSENHAQVLNIFDNGIQEQESTTVPLIGNINYGPDGTLLSYNYPNGKRVLRTLDSMNRTLTRTFDLPFNMVSATRNYTYDNLNRIVVVDINYPQDVSEAYSYDDLGQLLSANVNHPTKGNTSFTYTYDGFGNLASSKVGNDPAVTIDTNQVTNRLESIENLSELYSPFGELKKNFVNEREQTYFYYPNGRLKTVIETASPTRAFKYYYDPFGIRVLKSDESDANSSIHTLYLYDETNNVLSEFLTNDSTSSLEWDKSYIYFDGSLAISYEASANLVQDAYAQCVPLINGRIQDPTLIWESSSNYDNYDVEIWSQNNAVVANYSQVLQKELNLGTSFKYGSYKYRVKTIDGAWSNWSDFVYGPDPYVGFNVYLRCEGNGLDSSPNGNHFLLNGPTTRVGFEGDGLNFTAGSSMSLQAPSNFPGPGEAFTVSMYINPNQPGGGGAEEGSSCYVFEFGYGSALTKFYLGYDEAGFLFFQSGGRTMAIRSGSLSWNTWNHIQITFSPSVGSEEPKSSWYEISDNFSISLNSNQIFSGSVSLNSDPSGPWLIGRSVKGMQGGLDEFSIELLVP